MPKVTLLCHTPDPQRVVAAAAKLCYSSQTVEGLLDGLTDEKAVHHCIKAVEQHGQHGGDHEFHKLPFRRSGIHKNLLMYKLSRQRAPDAGSVRTGRGGGMQ